MPVTETTRQGAAPQMGRVPVSLASVTLKKCQFSEETILRVNASNCVTTQVPARCGRAPERIGPSQSSQYKA